jgi:hypothetical protein
MGLPMEGPLSTLVNPELESSRKVKASKKIGGLVGRKVGRKPGSRKLEGKPDAEDIRLLALERTTAISNMVNPVLSSSNILLFSVGQSGQRKKTNKRSSFKFAAGVNNIKNYFCSEGGSLGSTKTKLSESACLEQVQEVNSHNRTSLSDSLGNQSELSGSCEIQNHYPSNAQTIHTYCDQGLLKAETS